MFTADRVRRQIGQRRNATRRREHILSAVRWIGSRSQAADAEEGKRQEHEYQFEGETRTVREVVTISSFEMSAALKVMFDDCEYSSRDQNSRARANEMADV